MTTIKKAVNLPGGGTTPLDVNTLYAEDWNALTELAVSNSYLTNLRDLIRNITAYTPWLSAVTPSDNQWRSVVWSPELSLFCAVSLTGTLDRVMTSPDGINWTARTTPNNNNYTSVTWSPELSLFCAVTSTGTLNRIMTSPDGINWTARTTPNNNNWFGIAWSPELGIFCAVSTTGTLDRVMTSKIITTT